MYSIVSMKIYDVTDALTPDLVEVLMKEAFESVTCN
jgi:hypothetical protein